MHVADCAAALTIPIGTIWMIGIGSGTVIGLLSASLILLDTPDAADLARKIFVVYFESMQAALGIATIRATACAKFPASRGFRRLGTLRGVNCRVAPLRSSLSIHAGIYLNSKIEKAASGLLFIGIGGMLLLHVFQMSFSFGFLPRTSWSLPLKLWLNCPVVRQHVESGLLASSDKS